jgi:hypothetical protein
MYQYWLLILDHPIFGIFHLSFSGDLAARATAAPGPGQPAGVAWRFAGREKLGRFSWGK